MSDQSGDDKGQRGRDVVVVVLALPLVYAAVEYGVVSLRWLIQAWPQSPLFYAANILVMGTQVVLYGLAVWLLLAHISHPKGWMVVALGAAAQGVVIVTSPFAISASEASLRAHGIDGLILAVYLLVLAALVPHYRRRGLGV